MIVSLVSTPHFLQIYKAMLSRISVTVVAQLNMAALATMLDHLKEKRCRILPT